MKSETKKQLALTLALCLALSLPRAGAVHAEQAPADITLSSSNQGLAAGFEWAKAMARSKVVAESDNTIACYQAALQDRPVFCQRDYVHHIQGAHLLGLDEENYQMMKAFPQHQTQARQWYTGWELNYDGSLSGIDYVNDSKFWRSLPGMFELVEGAYWQYLWTGDRRIFEDPDLWGFYTKTVTDFVAVHDENHNGIAQEHSYDGWKGTASYNEAGKIALAESADSLGSQYQAFAAYGEMLRARGETGQAELWAQKAAELKAVFNTSWYAEAEDTYIRAFTEPDFSPKTDFAYESSWFIPYKELCEPGERAQKYLDFLAKSFNESPSINIEAWTYLPETFYMWNQNVRARGYLERLMASRSDYPEVSFNVIHQTVTGMMGVLPDAAHHHVTTLGRLTDSEEWVQIDQILLGDNRFSIRHENGNHTSLFQNTTGTQALVWTACFPGSYAELNVNGAAAAAYSAQRNGLTVSCVDVTVAPGAQASVSTGLSKASVSELVVNGGFEDGDIGWVFGRGAGIGENNPSSGAQHAYIDNGTTKQFSQTVTVPDAGTYCASAWISAKGPQGKFTVKVNGAERGSAAIPNYSGYLRQEIPHLQLSAGDQVELIFTGPRLLVNNWVNVDEVSLKREASPGGLC